LSEDALTIIIRAGTGERLQALEKPLLDWFAGDPRRFGPALRLYATTQGANASALGLRAAADLLQRSKVQVVAQTLLRWAIDNPGTDELTAQIASLAVTTLSDDPDARRLSDQLAERAASRLLEGRDAGPGPVTFSRTGWTRFAQLIRLQLEEAAASETKASEEAAAARAETERLQRLAERRTESLTEARAATGERSSRDAIQLSSTLLRPIAIALADSYQANSLEALRDRLLSVLQRGRIHQFVVAGDVVDFDPVRHEWVGEGYPSDQVKAMSPGFAVSTEGEEDVVVVPARVVAP
jgi:molecular chaperone GrpE (heat shock protein)